jgi:predicted  nucleic acid-binding Zn-ribbon protein
MAIDTAADTFRTLHRIHQQLADLNDRIAAGPRLIAQQTKQVEAAEAKRVEVQEEVKRAKAAADQKQLQLRSAEAKILDLEGKLNACKTNREYQLLREQIAADKMATKVLEDEILEGLERVDAIRNTLPAAEAVLAATKKQLEETKARVAGESASLNAEVQRVRGLQEDSEKELAPEARPLYERGVKHRGADALAAVEGDCCGGCFQQITSKMSSDLMLGHVVACRSCGRLLYTPETRPVG